MATLPDQLADPTRTLDTAASQPLNFTQQFGSQAATAQQTSNFGKALETLLTQYQQLGTRAQAQTRLGQLNYSDAGLNASNKALTDPGLQGYAPSTIFNAGSTAQAPFQAGEAGVGKVGQSFNEQLQNYGNILESANRFMVARQAEQEKAQNDARDIINQAMAIGGDALNNLLTSQPELIKTAGYDPKTLQGFAQSLKTKESSSQNQTNKDLALQYGVTTPLFKRGEEYVRVGDGHAIGSLEEFRQIYGITPAEAEAKGMVTELSPQQLARTNNIIDPPKNSDTNLSSSDAKIREFLLKNKRDNPNVPWYDLWGKLADELKMEQLNPTNYDYIFWEILHPEGLEGYKKYKQQGLINPFGWQ